MRKLNVTDRRTDRQTDRRTGGVAISPVPGPTAPAGDNMKKSRGTRGTKMSANADLITVETYVQQGNSVARDLPPTGSEANTTIVVFL